MHRTAPHRTLARLAAGIACGLLVTACTSGNEPVKLTPAQAKASEPPAHTGSMGAATARPGSPANPNANPHAGGMAGAMPGAGVKSASALQFTVPEGWIVQIPAGTMRKAQFQLPKEGNDPEDAQLILYYFGGEGGSKKDNLERWAGQFVQPDGRSSQDVLETSTRKVNGMEVLEASITGTFDSELMPGQGDRVRLENWSMLAAIIDTPDGPYFAKMTGPKGTVARWESSFRAWVSSLQPTKG